MDFKIRLKKYLFRACFQVIFLTISDRKHQRLGLPNQGVRIQGIAKIDLFTETVFFVTLKVDFSFLFVVLGAVFLVL